MIPINKKGVYYLTQIQQSSVAMHHPEVVAAGAAQSHRPAQRHGCSSQDVSRRRPAGRSQGKKRVLQRHGSQHRKTYASTSSPPAGSATRSRASIRMAHPEVVTGQ